MADGASRSELVLATAMAEQARHRASRRGQRNVTFDATRFRGVEQEKEHGRLWGKMKIVIERRWVLSQFDVDPYFWTEPLTQRQWLGVARYKGQYSTSLVAEFMANISSNVTSNRFIIRSWVRGREIVITPDSFAQQFGLPRIANPQFNHDGVGAPSHEEMCAEILAPGESWFTSQARIRQLAPRYHPLFLWTCYTIFPLGRTVECSKFRGQLMWAIGTGRTIDLPLIMFMALRAGTQLATSQASIPFGCFITARVRAAGVSVDDVILQTSRTDIDLITEKRSAGQLEGVQRRAQATRPQPEQQADQAAHSQPTQPTQPEQQQQSQEASTVEVLLQQIAASQSETIQWQTAMSARLDQQDTAIAALSTQLTTIQEQQQVQSSRLQEIIQHLRHPPPDEDGDFFANLDVV